MSNTSITLLGATVALARARCNLAPVEAEYKRLRALRDEADKVLRERALTKHQSTGATGELARGVEVRLSTSVEGADSDETFQWVLEKAQHFLLKTDASAIRKNKERLVKLGCPIQIRTVPVVRVASDLSDVLEEGGAE